MFCYDNDVDGKLADGTPHNHGQVRAEEAKKQYQSLGYKGNLEEYQSQLLSMAHNLFSWNSRTISTPHELSRLTYPWMEIACNAIFISSGQVFVQIQENESGEPELILDAALMRKQRGYTKDCKEWASSWRFR